MTLSTYLNFDGNCREAFEYYRDVFGGDFMVMETFRNGPPDMGLPENELDNVMHVSLTIGSSVLMGSDVPSYVRTAPQTGQQLLDQHRRGVSGRVRRPVRQAGQGRQRDHADAGHVLGLILRRVHRQVRHQLAGQLRARTGVACPTDEP